MGEAIITRRAGDSFAAFITVTYPAGAVCTCVMGTKVLTAPDTSGTAVFKVRKAGTYTVTATDGSSTDSVDVVITQDGQQESVLLQFCVAINTLPVGALVKANVNGSGINFRIVHQGNPSTSIYDASCDGSWLLMEDIYETRQFASNNTNTYANTTLHSYLNSTFLELFDVGVQSLIKQVKIPYVNGSGEYGSIAEGANGLSTKIFVPSRKELYNGSFSNDKVLGVTLSYFTGSPTSDGRLRKLYNGAETDWWTRSPGTTYQWAQSGFWYVYRNGLNISNCGYANTSNGVCPMFILDKTTALVQPEPNADGSYTLLT